MANVSATQTNEKIVVDNVAALSTLNTTGLPKPIDGQLVETLGYYTPGDGGGNLYVYNAADASVVDWGNVMDGLGGDNTSATLQVTATTAGTGTGRFLATNDLKSANALQWGCIGDNAFDNQFRANQMLQSLWDQDGGDAFFPPGNYVTNATLVMPMAAFPADFWNVTIRGSSVRNTLITGSVAAAGIIQATGFFGTYSTISDIRVFNTAADGIGIDLTGEFTEVMRCNVFGNATGIFINAGNRTLIDQTTFQANTSGAGLAAQNTTGLRIIDCRNDGGHVGVFLSQCDRTFIHGLNFGSTNSGIYASGGVTKLGAVEFFNVGTAGGATLPTYNGETPTTEFIIYLDDATMVCSDAANFRGINIRSTNLNEQDFVLINNSTLLGANHDGGNQRNSFIDATSKVVWAHVVDGNPGRTGGRTYTNAIGYVDLSNQLGTGEFVSIDPASFVVDHATNLAATVGAANNAITPRVISEVGLAGASAVAWDSQMGEVRQLTFSAAIGANGSNEIELDYIPVAINTGNTNLWSCWFMADVDTTIQWSTAVLPAYVNTAFLQAGVWTRVTQFIAALGVTQPQTILIHPADAAGAQLSIARLFQFDGSVEECQKIVTDISKGGWNSGLGDELWMSTTAPTGGTWPVGKKFYNVAPAGPGSIGWVCTVAGTPGTWVAF